MPSVKYPGLDSHRDLHRKLTLDVRGILLKMKQDKHVFPTELIDLTTEMLLNHTLVEDLKIKLHLEQAEKDRHEARLLEFIKNREAASMALDQTCKMLKKDTITEETYLARKKELLEAFVRFDDPPPTEKVDDRLALLDVFETKGWMDEDEAGRYKIKLFANVDIDETFQLHNRRFENEEPGKDETQPDIVQLL